MVYVVFDGGMVRACVEHMSCYHDVHIANVMMARVRGCGCVSCAPAGSMCEAGCEAKVG